MQPVSVAEAEKIVLNSAKGLGVEAIPFENALGRILAEDIIADRHLPPYDRVTMDGIAIRHAAFAQGNRTFRIKGTMAAGDVPMNISADDECIELMTGCALPETTDTVIRYEDVAIADGSATILCAELRKSANVHHAGSDKQKGSIVIAKGTSIDATAMNMAASVGKHMLLVQKLPRVAIISTGDELVPVNEIPSAYQVRISNSYAIKAMLQPMGIEANTLHINDSDLATNKQLQHCVAEYDVLILSGGVSMGKFDHLPRLLEEMGVTKLFHKVKQRPGKPFWFGSHSASGAVVFAFPGNPVSAFMCAHRYLVPWVRASLQQTASNPVFAALTEEVTFLPQLQFFLQVKAFVNSEGHIVATPVGGNGSGDFSSLTEANAFMELPEESNNFPQGSVQRIWPFKTII